MPLVCLFEAEAIMEQRALSHTQMVQCSPAKYQLKICLEGVASVSHGIYFAVWFLSGGGLRLMSLARRKSTAGVWAFRSVEMRSYV